LVISKAKGVVSGINVYRPTRLSWIFVEGREEGIMLSKKGNLEEERRICFVGMSRAMKPLYLSHSHAFPGMECSDPHSWKR
jgi:superfamily I DNA/RNA helicase